MSEIFTVFGAQGPLGLSVVKAFAKSYKVKALVLDNSDLDSFRGLDNVTAHQVNVDKQDELKDILEGSKGVFVTTYTEFDCLDGYNSEVSLGKKISEACKRAEVEHVIYNNTLSVVQVLGLR